MDYLSKRRYINTKLLHTADLVAIAARYKL